MKKETNILARFKQWILSIVKCRFFLYKRTYYFEPFVYLDENNNVTTEMTDRMKWLDDTYIIKDYCEENAYKVAKKRVSKIYKNVNEVYFY